MKLVKVLAIIVLLCAVLSGCVTKTELPISGTYTVDDSVVYVYGEYSEGLMPYTVALSDLDRDRLEGYLDDKGNIAIEPQFVHARPFSGGLAAVCGKNAKYGYIDKTGTYIIPPIYEDAMEFTETGFAAVRIEQESYAIIDRKNQVQKTGRNIWNLANIGTDRVYFYIFDPDGASELLDDELRVVIPKELGYTNIYTYNLRGSVFVVTKNDMRGLYDIDAKKEILPPVYVQLEVIDDKYIATIDKNGNFAMLDMTGKTLFTRSGIARNEFADVYMDEFYSYITPDHFILLEYGSETKKSVLVDASGEVIKDFGMRLYKYGSAGNVVYTENENEMRCGVLNPDGSFLLEPEFLRISLGMDGEYLCEKPDEHYTQYIYGADGQLFKSIEEAEHIYDNGKNYVLMRTDDKTTILDEKFEEIATFDSLETNTEHVLFGETDGKKKLALVSVPAEDVKKNDKTYRPIEYTEPLLHTVVFKNESDRYYKDGRVQIIRDGVKIENGYISESLYDAAGIMCDYPWGGGTVVTLTTKNAGITYDMQTKEAWVWHYDVQNGVTESKTTLDDTLVTSDFKVNLKLLAILTDSTYEEDNGFIYWSEKPLTDAEKKVAQEALHDGAYSFTDYPVIDGSTATIPFSQKLTQELIGVDEKEAELLTYHSTTHFAYERLIDGGADLIFVTQPSPDELALAKSSGVELEVIPFSREAFVFLTHVDNPVDSLSVKQIQDIYTGNITNWSEVGGMDEPIVAYQRTQNSGSQTIMESEVMAGLTMAEPPRELLIAGMGGLVDSVADYENGKNSIGYNMFIFVRDMYVNNEVKLIAVDGVAPANETVANDTYPFCVNYYMVYRSDEPADSPVRKVAEYVLSDTGQKIVEQSGLVSMTK